MPFINMFTLKKHTWLKSDHQATRINKVYALSSYSKIQEYSNSLFAKMKYKLPPDLVPFKCWGYPKASDDQGQHKVLQEFKLDNFKITVNLLSVFLSPSHTPSSLAQYHYQVETFAILCSDNYNGPSIGLSEYSLVPIKSTL